MRKAAIALSLCAAVACETRPQPPSTPRAEPEPVVAKPAEPSPPAPAPAPPSRGECPGGGILCGGSTGVPKCSEGQHVSIESGHPECVSAPKAECIGGHRNEAGVWVGGRRRYTGPNGESMVATCTPGEDKEVDIDAMVSNPNNSGGRCGPGARTAALRKIPCK